MAYSNAGFNVIGAAKKGNAPSMYTYTSADAIATVNTAGYFNDLSDTLAVGDIIFVHDSATPTMSIVMVASNASGVVDVTDGTAIAMTDSD
ncbi:MAG: hypothetical protein ACPHUD_09970 [Porticoccaceae bacterium]|jgi:hypothetical protein